MIGAEADDPAIGRKPTQILTSASAADVCPDRLDAHADALIAEAGQGNRRMRKLDLGLEPEIGADEHFVRVRFFEFVLACARHQHYEHADSQIYSISR